MSKMRQAISGAVTGPAETPAAGTLLRHFTFLPDFPGFAGHFPGFPILPGVVQVLAALTVAEQLHGGRLRLVGVEHAKFQLQLRPGDDLTVAVRARRNDERLAFEARLQRGTQSAAIFTLVAAAAGAP